MLRRRDVSGQARRGEQFQPVKRELVVLRCPCLAQPGLHGGPVAFGEMVEHVALLMANTALHRLERLEPLERAVAGITPRRKIWPRLGTPTTCNAPLSWGSTLYLRLSINASISRSTRSRRPWDTKTPAPLPGTGAVRPSTKWSGRTVRIGLIMRFLAVLRSFCGLKSQAIPGRMTANFELEWRLRPYTVPVAVRFDSHSKTSPFSI